MILTWFFTWLFTWLFTSSGVCTGTTTWPAHDRGAGALHARRQCTRRQSSAWSCLPVDGRRSGGGSFCCSWFVTLNITVIKHGGVTTSRYPLCPYFSNLRLDGYELTAVSSSLTAELFTMFDILLILLIFRKLSLVSLTSFVQETYAV